MEILIIDDEKAQRDILRDILTDAGYKVIDAANGEDGIKLFREYHSPVVLTDLKMPGKDGMQVLEEAKQINPDVQVIMMTAFGTIPGAVTAIKIGAYDYLTKPLNKDDLLRVVKRAAEKASLLMENIRLKKEISSRYQYENLIGKSPAMQKIYQLIDRIKDIEATALITGESGTGKELVARAIHFNDRRKNGPFIAVNCGAIPENLIESELFGHEKGSFTGANRDYPGRFEQAQAGTLFLDEIGTMRIDLQIRLLRVLQDKKVQRIGSGKTIDLDVRVIAASNEDLNQKVREGFFRNDLYHRLNVFHIHLPPLRERPEDIPLLTRHFLSACARQYSKPEPKLAADALKRLENFNYPGNVRELEHIIEKTIILSDSDVIHANDLILPDDNKDIHPKETVDSLIGMEARMIDNALKESGGSLKNAAEKLGITYKTLQYRVKKFGIDKKKYK
ncbi:MAG: sigma-54-dependent Fis family transcriptional regulator [Calditrichaceae bacterium]|nr:sigma-54-dependent Fis family transcriptional regulator [Calditrichaceae bacterium]MBN2708902.1 sigma-54-dependent Fis family transcriptional regulator [Calditrichaceae bacterium]RQV97574.1 MAG: sigma-54-dependent Fis family transcriptional regulator [Calditrichota bacterium]